MKRYTNFCMVPITPPDMQLPPAPAQREPPLRRREDRSPRHEHSPLLCARVSRLRRTIPPPLSALSPAARSPSVNSRIKLCTMGNILSEATTYLSISLCDGSSRKLIAGWWYFILFISIVQIFIALYTMSSRGGTEAFISLWSSIVLLMLCVGGTVIMRKFQSSVAVGFFMGSVVAAAQMFFLIFLVLFGYIEDRIENDLPVDGERLNSFVCLFQSLLLGSFAAIMAAHRSEILDQKISDPDDGAAYDAPNMTTVV